MKAWPHSFENGADFYNYTHAAVVRIFTVSNRFEEKIEELNHTFDVIIELIIDTVYDNNAYFRYFTLPHRTVFKHIMTYDPC